MPADDASRAVAEPGLAAIARAIIDASRYMTLATADEDGRPWASPVFYAAADYAEFYWISAPGSTHSRNLAQRPRISIVIFDSGVAEGAGQAVYMAATAEQVADGDLARGSPSIPARRTPARTLSPLSNSRGRPLTASTGPLFLSTGSSAHGTPARARSMASPSTIGSRSASRTGTASHPAAALPAR
jgi:hypothetical protein